MSSLLFFVLLLLALLVLLFAAVYHVLLLFYTLWLIRYAILEPAFYIWKILYLVTICSRYQYYVSSFWSTFVTNILMFQDIPQVPYYPHFLLCNSLLDKNCSIFHWNVYLHIVSLTKAGRSIWWRHSPTPKIQIQNHWWSRETWWWTTKDLWWNYDRVWQWSTNWTCSFSGGRGKLTSWILHSSSSENWLFRMWIGTSDTKPFFDI